jgi:hypothetical protein
MTLAYRRATTFAVAATAAIALAAPALATTHPASTSRNLRASKTVVKAHHSVNFTATLSSSGQGLAGQAGQLAVQERHVSPSGHKSSWAAPTFVAPISDAGNGNYTFSVTPDIAAGHHTQKDQFRVLYAGTSDYNGVAYKGSHSEVITVTVKRASA